MRTARRIVAAVAAVVGLGLAAGVGWAVNFVVSYQQLDRSTVGSLDFSQPLAVPPLAESTTDEHGRKKFHLTIQSGQTEFLPGKQTATWGINGTYLAPTVRAQRGDTVVLDVENGLSETTTLHWHGMHLPAEMDGGPHQMIRPGTIWSPTWTIDQPASTMWFHPHMHQQTAMHVYRGVAGMFLVDDDAGPQLPDEYGVDDIPLILQDKNFHDDGSLDTRHATFTQQIAGAGNVGILGDTVLVNGTYNPHLEVRHSLVRLRILNASNARTYNLGFPDDRPLTVIGTDGRLLERPVDLRRLQVSPGERFEVLVALGAGDRPVLRSFPADLGSGFPLRRFAGADDTLDILQLRAAEQLAPAIEVPPQLVTVEQPDVTGAEERSFELLGVSINGRTMDMSRVDGVFTAGSTEVWTVINTDEAPHNFHVHGVSFQVLDIGGEPVPAHLAGLKDTVYLPPGTPLRIAVTFEDYTSTTWPYMLHCHLLRHEDQGMMIQFLVVQPGEEDSVSRVLSRHAHHN